MVNFLKLADSTDCTTAPPITGADLTQIEKNIMSPGLACCNGTVVTPGTGLSLDILPLTALVQFENTVITPSETSTKWACSDSTESLSLTAADATNDRIDIVVICVDGASNPNATASNLVTLQVVAGIPAATPVAPSAPADCTKIAEVTVSAGATAVSGSDIVQNCLQIQDCVLNENISRCHDSNRFFYENTGTADAVVVCDTCTQPFEVGSYVQFKQNGVNTGAVSIEFCGNVGSLKKFGGSTDMVAGDLVDCMIVSAVWNGTDWVLQNAGVTQISDNAFDASWDGITGEAASKNAIYDALINDNYISSTSVASPGGIITTPANANKAIVDCVTANTLPAGGGRGQVTVYRNGNQIAAFQETGNGSVNTVNVTWNTANLAIGFTGSVAGGSAAVHFYQF